MRSRHDRGRSASNAISSRSTSTGTATPPRHAPAATDERPTTARLSTVRRADQGRAPARSPPPTRTCCWYPRGKRRHAEDRTHSRRAHRTNGAVGNGTTRVMDKCVSLGARSQPWCSLGVLLRLRVYGGLLTMAGSHEEPVLRLASTPSCTSATLRTSPGTLPVSWCHRHSADYGDFMELVPVPSGTALAARCW